MSSAAAAGGAGGGAGSAAPITTATAATTAAATTAATETTTWTRKQVMDRCDAQLIEMGMEPETMVHNPTLRHPVYCYQGG